MLGWFASIGGVVGAAVGANHRKGVSPSWWRMRFRPATLVLVVRTDDDADQDLTRTVLEASFRGRDGAATESR